MTYQPGDILLDKYRIQELVGRGAFAEVYKVTHLSLNVTRAIKVLHRETPGVGSTEFKDYHERFELEARLGAKLNTPTPHPNLLQVFDFMQAGDLLVLEMEYASGGSLYNRIQKAKAEDKPLQVEETLQMAIDVAEGLSAVHAVDAVHRDLKPTNILFDAQDCAKLADLGLAQVPGGPSMRTQLGSMAPRHPGTPGYMSPEQEDTSKYLKPASDIYALGLVLFEILTGRNYSNLKTGTRAKSMRPDVPTWLDDLIAGLLEKDPENRLWDCRKLAVLLRQGKESQARRLINKGWESQRQQIQKLWPKFALGLLVLLASSTIAFFVFKYWNIKQNAQNEVSAARTMPSGTIQISNTPRPMPTLTIEQTGTPLTPTRTAFAATHTPLPSPTSPPPLQAGVTQISEKDGMLMVYVPEGEFLMGSVEEDDPDVSDDKKPQHPVYLDTFWIDRTEVTNAMFAQFLNEESNQSEGGADWLDARDEDERLVQSGSEWQPVSGYGEHPVVDVTWYGAQAYCRWAGRRLPSEAEWEKAARGTDGRTYPWGEGIDCTRANFYKNYESGSCVGDTKPVSSYPDGASPYGALDMAGNVWEWVADWYDDDYYNSSSSENPAGPASGQYRVLRGGSWYDSAARVRTANRGRFWPDGAWADYGFRCARSP